MMKYNFKIQSREAPEPVPFFNYFILNFNLNEDSIGNCLTEDITQHSKKEVGCFIQVWRGANVTLNN